MAQRNLPADVFGEAFAKLSFFDIYLYLGLVSIADGTGRGDASAKHLKHTIFSEKPRTAEKDIVSSLERLVEQGRVILNERMGVTCFYLPSWSQEQRVRGRSKGAEKSEKDVRGTAPHRAAHPLSPSSPLPPHPYYPIIPNPDDDDKKLNQEKNAPTREEVAAFWDANGFGWSNDTDFYTYCEEYGWHNITNWKSYARWWERKAREQCERLLAEEQSAFERIRRMRSDEDGKA